MSLPSAARCAVHPGRPAADTCPTCGRPRCGADAASADDCLACRASATAVVTPRPLESVVRAGLAAVPVCVLGGMVASQYVGARFFSLVTPLLVGVAAGAVSVAVSRPSPGRSRTLVRLVAVGFAVLGAAYGFRLVPGGHSPLHPAGQVLPPYVAAVAGAWLWSAPPRRRQRPAPGGRSLSG